MPALPDALSPRAPVLAPLTGIRFLAAFSLFNFHANNVPGGPEVLDGVALAGHDWMTMFFILSGLVLTWNYDEVLGTRLSGRGLRTYFVARFARIYPLYLLALIVVALLTMKAPGDLIALLSDPTWWAHVLAVQTWSGDLGVAYGFNGPGWSIGVELFLYALFPLLLVPFRAIRSRPRALIIVAVVAVAVTFAMAALTYLLGTAQLPAEDPASAHRWLYRTPLTRLPDFVLGISLGYLLLATRNRDLARTGVVLQSIGGIAVIGLMVIPGLPFTIWSLDSANTVPFGLLMLGLVWAPHTRLARFLAGPAMTLLGESAYAFYLWHQTILALVWQGETTTTAWAITWVVALVITTLVAVGSHLLVERPARTWLRRHLAGQGPAATAAVVRP